MIGFILALQFLTILPIATKSAVDQERLPQGIAYFPLVGLFLGLILTGCNILFSQLLFSRFLASAILVILLIILTGALHLDGLADTADALLSRKKRSEMLKIMRDAQVGTMGALSLICVILIKVSLLYSLAPEVVNRALILMCLLSRYCLVLALFLFPYIRAQGKAKVFARGINRKIFSVATISTIFLAAVFWRTKGLIVFIAVAALSFFAGKLIRKKIGGITGDSLGAINELTESLVLLTIFILTR